MLPIQQGGFFMKKKLLFATLLMSLSISVLSGCTTKAPQTTSPVDVPKTSESPEPSSGDVDVLEIYQYKVEFAESFNKLASIYENETGTKISITTVGGGSDYGAALKANFATGAGPAIFNIGGPEDVKDWDGKLANLSETKAAEVALKGTLEPVSVGENIYGLPYNQEGYGLIYNKSVFAEAGIEPTSIDTYEKLEAAVKEIDSKKDELGLDAVFAFPVAETWVTGLHTMSPIIAGEFGDVLNTYSAKELEFKYADSFKKIIDLQNTFSVQPTITLDYSAQVERLFSLGKVALIQQGNWAYGSIEGIDPEFAENNIGMIPLQFEGVNEGTLPVGVPMYWGVNSNLDEATQQAAKDFLDWMYTSEVGKNFCLDEFKFIPAYEGYDLDKIADPLSKDVYSYSLAGNTSNWVFMGFPTDWGQGVVGESIQKYISGNLEWDELVNNAKQKWNESRQ
jgi:raffinose/stachyose/melibiose transport system substrate-binding protein